MSGAPAETGRRDALRAAAGAVAAAAALPPEMAEAASAEFGFQDWLAIMNLLTAYTHHADGGHSRPVPGLDRPLPAPGTTLPPRGNLLYPDTLTMKTHHVTSNVSILPDGPDRASGTAYFTVFQATEDFPLQCIVTGVYRDKYRKVDGVWGFAERYYDFRLFGDLTRHAAEHVRVGPGKRVANYPVYGVPPYGTGSGK